MQAQRKIAVAGATGRVGRHIVEVLEERGHHVVPISRTLGVDVITGAGLAEALAGVEIVIDAATGPSPEQQAATEFFTTAAHNLQEAGRDAGAQRIVAVSIIGTDKFTDGYGAAKQAHERATLSGPVPGRVLRAAQFHEFVGQLVEWGTQGDVGYVPKMRTQLVSARSVAEALANYALNDAPTVPTILEIAGPREERLVEMARLYVAKRGRPARVQEADDPTDAQQQISEAGGLLPGPGAILAGPTFASWLESAQA